jgi:hypothetical protein
MLLHWQGRVLVMGNVNVMLAQQYGNLVTSKLRPFNGSAPAQEVVASEPVATRVQPNTTIVFQVGALVPVHTITP